MILLLRHGETEWSRTGRHTGRTDIPLTENGETQAAKLAPVADRPFALVLSSPAQRARRTAALAGLDPEIDENLWEWDYGAYEGITTPQIHETRPDWYLWTDGVPSGETPGEMAEQVGRRADAVLDRARGADGDVALVAHGHFLRVLAARWLGLAADQGRYFKLDTGTYCTLGTEHARPVITGWNIPA